MLLAISALKNNEISNIREAARVYDVPRSTLQDRLRGKTHRNETRANSHKMTRNEEESLVQWILSLDQRGAAPRPAHIQEMADILISKQGDTTTTTVGDKWVYNFIKHHDILKSRFSRQYNHQRAKCEDPNIIQEWFNRVQIILMQHGIPYEDIYNFDETGYAMGLVATAKVVTRAEMTGRPFLVQSGNWEWLHLLSVSTLQDGFCHHALSSRERSILRDDMKIRPYCVTGGLKSVIMDGQQTRLA